MSTDEKSEVAALREELADKHEELSAVLGRESLTEQRLTAAEQRNAELTKALQNLKAAWAASPESITAPEYQEARDVLAKKAWIPAIDAVMSAEWMPSEPIYQTEWLGDGGGRWIDITAEQYERFSTLPHYNVRTVYATALKPTESGA